MTADPIGIGVDVGGTSIKFGAVDRNGHILRQFSHETLADGGPDVVMERIALGVNALLDELGDRAAGIGLGVPGVVNDRGEISYPPNFPGWGVVAVADRLRPLLSVSLPIMVENDANVAAFAEARADGGAGAESFLFVTLGTGVGGCIIVDRTIWRGMTGGAGEIGHVSIDLNGRPCMCGSRGCIEAYIGQRYMSAIALERLADAPNSILHRRIAEGHQINPRLLDLAADAGDIFARDFLAEMGTMLGAALASTLNLCDLHLVIVGGGMSRAERYLLEPARRSLRERVLKSIAGDVELRAARLFNDAGIVGAALLGLSQRPPLAES